MQRAERSGLLQFASTELTPKVAVYEVDWRVKSGDVSVGVEYIQPRLMYPPRRIDLLEISLSSAISKMGYDLVEG
jgi:hypothetical protein